MKLNRDFIAHMTDEQSVLIPVGGTAFSGIVKGNAALGELLSLLEQDRPEGELVAEGPQPGTYDTRHYRLPEYVWHPSIWKML